MRSLGQMLVGMSQKFMIGAVSLIHLVIDEQ